LCPLKPIKASLTISLGYQKNLQSLLNRKKAVHEGDRQALRDVQREFKRQILVDKEAYKQRVERTLSSGNTRVAWQGIKSMANAPNTQSAGEKPMLSLGDMRARTWL
jgi:hypothetical protein